ncbi:hypothetical protein P2Q00_37135 [Streptomyces coacervatus]|uniref:hypothetical protein n=1 Tax=Streptomyces coacervatus TaxID=647381 RepID=UPI0023DA1196|nr:hypothetical protein [Streptomyces coacervatus]MDF2271011.1 hypothetical protein [Streptomyces coacervatus]
MNDSRGSLSITWGVRRLPSSINPYHLDDADGGYNNTARHLPASGHWSFFARAL